MLQASRFLYNEWSEQCAGIYIRQGHSFCDSLEGDMAIIGIQTLHQCGIGFAGGFSTHIGDLQGVGEGSSSEGQGGGSGNGTGHISNRIVENAVLDEEGVGVSGDSIYGFDGAALVNGNIHQNTARAHGFDHFFGDQLGRFRTGNQDAANYQVGMFYSVGNVIGVGQKGLDAAAEDIVQVCEAFEADIQNGYIGTKANGHFGCVCAHIATAHDNHICALYACYTAQQDASAAAVRFQKAGTNLNGQTACNLTHGREQGKRVIRELYSFVSDACNFFTQERMGLSGVRSKVQIGEQNLSLMEQIIFRFQRLFDLNDHFRGVIDFFRGWKNLRTDGEIFVVGEATGKSGVFLHIYRVSCTNQSISTCRGETHAAFLGFDFLWTSNTHNHCSFLICVCLYYTINRVKIKINIDGMHILILGGGCDMINEQKFERSAGMTEVTFYQVDETEESKIKYVVIAVRYQRQWVFSRHKERVTWDMPGGHREAGETLLEAAERELWEETGATEYELHPVTVYGVKKDGSESYGILYYGDITVLEELPKEYEMAEVCLVDKLPEKLTYPDILPELFLKVQGWLNLQSSADELWDVYDENRKLTGRLHRRGDPMKDGDYHLVVHIWMMNSKGEFLLTKRSPDKGFPNMWESTGGSALAGDDSLTAALREVKEETGLELDPAKGKLVLTYHISDYFRDVWLFRQDFDLEDVVLQPGETIDKMYADRNTIFRLMESGEFVPYGYLRDLMEVADAVDS